MNILEEIYFGNIVPADKRFTPGSKYALAARKWIEQSSQYTADMTPDELKKFNELTDLQGEMSELLNIECFEQGFRMGAQMMLAALADKS